MPKVEKAPKAARSTDEVLNIPMAQVTLSDVELSFEPTTVEFERDGKKQSFKQDPGLNAKVNIDEVLVGNKEHAGKSFWQRWRMKWNKKREVWEVREDTSYGNLVEVVKGEGILAEDDPRELILEGEDFEGFSLLATVVPKINPETKQELGSMLKWDGVYAQDPEQPDPAKVATAVAAADAMADELPDDHEEQIHDKLGV